MCNNLYYAKIFYINNKEKEVSIIKKLIIIITSFLLIGCNLTDTYEDVSIKEKIQIEDNISNALSNVESEEIEEEIETEGTEIEKHEEGISSELSNDDVIDEDNWINNNYIKEVRDIYISIENLIGNEELEERRKEWAYSEPYIPTVKIIYGDSNGIIRKYVVEGGSDDSALRQEYYYDLNQILRFIFIVGGAVNGTTIEHRVYFDDTGNKIWEVQKIEGEGYPFFSEWEQENYILNPSKNYEHDD